MTMFRRLWFRHSDLLKRISYDRKTGVFQSLRFRKPVGKQNGTAGRMIYVFGRYYYAHRLAWFYVYKEDPAAFDVQHINGNNLDNRIFNLRRISPEMRKRQPRKNSRSRVVGVYEIGRKWAARIQVAGAKYYLGSFTRFEDAVAARKAAERRYLS